jgi:hypothetical protein
MSSDPNNPFQSDPEAPSDASAPRKGSKVWIWVLATLGVLALLGALVCCGGGYFAFQAGQSMLADAFKEQLQDTEVIRQHIGDIESMSLNLSATGEAAGGTGGTLVFDISGSKGSGQVLVQQAPGGDGTGIASAELVLSDGTRHQVDLGAPAPEVQLDENFEIDLGQPAETP